MKSFLFFPVFTPDIIREQNPCFKCWNQCAFVFGGSKESDSQEERFVDDQKKLKKLFYIYTLDAYFSYLFLSSKNILC